MEIFKFAIEDFEKYKIDIMTMLKQSYEKSFPTRSIDTASLLKRVEALKLYISENKAVVYGSKIGLSLAGFIWFFEKDSINNKIIHINSFVVHKDFRRQGVGRALWIEVEKYANQKGIPEIELIVTKDNEDAVDFYKKSNFEVERLVMKKRFSE